MNSMDDFRTQQNQLSQEILIEQITPFPQDISNCTAFNATPYIISMTCFSNSFGVSDQRNELIKALNEVIEAANLFGMKLLALLVGGSFLLLANASPRDLDCVFFYSVAEESGDISDRLLQLWHKAHQTAIDVRFIPYDADPLIALKACSFFSVLYGRTRHSAALSRGCILIHP